MHCSWCHHIVTLSTWNSVFVLWLNGCGGVIGTEKHMKMEYWASPEVKHDPLYPDIPRNTDCPYPIRIWAFFEMIRPYQILIRIWGKLWKIYFCVIFGCVAKEGQFCRRSNRPPCSTPFYFIIHFIFLLNLCQSAPSQPVYYMIFCAQEMTYIIIITIYLAVTRCRSRSIMCAWTSYANWLVCLMFCVYC